MNVVQEEIKMAREELILADLLKDKPFFREVALEVIEAVGV
jgi:hypothetical protein